MISKEDVVGEQCRSWGWRAMVDVKTRRRRGWAWEGGRLTIATRALNQVLENGNHTCQNTINALS
jgi:hypothetical protein